MFTVIFCLFLRINIADVALKQKVIYSNDQGYPPVGHCEGDNPQALVHFLYYSNEIDIQLIIASGSTNCAPAGTNVISANNILDLYQKDVEKLNSSAVKNGYDTYPTYKQLKSLTIQGSNGSCPQQGYTSYKLDSADRIISIVDSLDENEYVWYGAGAGLCELSTALHEKPAIADKIKLYSISAWNTKQDPYARWYIFNNFPNLWWIESNTTFHGWYSGGNQTGIYNNQTFDKDEISKSGNLGAYYSTLIPAGFSSPGFKEGDGPSYWYIIDPQHSNRNMSDPTLPNWGGQYMNYFNRNLYWSDIKNNPIETVNQWRVEYLNDWKTRLQWLY
eukprot:200729_1